MKFILKNLDNEELIVLEKNTPLEVYKNLVRAAFAIELGLNVVDELIDMISRTKILDEDGNEYQMEFKKVENASGLPTKRR